MVLRSGGHSYAGCSVVAGLIVHTGLMRGVRHLGNGIVEIAGGALNGDVYRALADARADVGGDGLAAPHGRCLGVGASAFLLGGGIGFAMRDHGLACDLVQEIEISAARRSGRARFGKARTPICSGPFAVAGEEISAWRCASPCVPSRPSR